MHQDFNQHAMILATARDESRLEGLELSSTPPVDHVEGSAATSEAVVAVAGDGHHATTVETEAGTEN
jgi:hypothetical protein